MIRVWRRIALAAWLVVAADCSSSTGPVAGTLQVKLISPNNSGLYLDAAAKLVLSSPTAPTSYSAGAGYLLWSGTPSTSATIVVTGVLRSGTLFTFQVDDINKVGSYSATLQQVAGSGYALRALDGYSLSVTK